MADATGSVVRTVRGVEILGEEALQAPHSALFDARLGARLEILPPPGEHAGRTGEGEERGGWGGAPKLLKATATEFAAAATGALARLAALGAAMMTAAVVVATGLVAATALTAVRVGTSTVQLAPTTLSLTAAPSVAA